MSKYLCASGGYCDAQCLENHNGTCEERYVKDNTPSHVERKAQRAERRDRDLARKREEQDRRW